MKKLIEESGKSLKEFAEFYEIPYNTVRQWYNGERKAAPWIKKLIEKAANGIQIKMNLEEENYITTLELKSGHEINIEKHKSYEEAAERKKTKTFKINLYKVIEVN